MPNPDFSDIQSRLLDSNDAALESAARSFGEVYNSSVKRPPLDILSAKAQIAAAVRESFPKRFVDTFRNWLEQDEAFLAALETADEIAIAQCYRTAFDALWQNWLRIVHFFPFILMVCINRLNRQALKDHAAAELGKAILHYEMFYNPPADVDKREADQRELLFSLLALFRKLSSKGLLGDEFFLQAVLAGRPFADVFPPRFDAEIRLLQEIRNLNTHHQLGQRDSEYLKLIHQLLEECFLDIVSILRPICEAFQFVYIRNIVLTPEPTAIGISLSGTSGPAPVRYKLPQAYQPDARQIHQGQLYIIARGRELSADASQPLEPADYLDLTPFLIFEARRVPQPSTPDAERYLFLLNEYEEHRRFLQFLEFAGAFDRTIPRRARTKGAAAPGPIDPAEREDADRLIDAIRVFKEAVARLRPSAPAGGYATDYGLDFRFVRKKLWDISKTHLTSIVAVEQFTEQGTYIEDAAPTLNRTAYVPELFTVPPDAAEVEKFLDSDKRGLVLVAPSGAGKSSLMAHTFLQQLRAGGVCLFLTGRLISGGSIAEFVRTECLSRLADDEVKFARFDRFLRRDDRTFVLFVDAVNEFAQAGGAIALLESLLNFVKDDNVLKRCRVVLSVRTETWSQFCDHFGTTRPLDATYFYSQSGDAIHLGRFDTVASGRALFGNYQRYYQLAPTSYDRLGASVRELIRRPFMMALIAETYSNLSIPPQLDYFELFNSLTDRKARDAARLLRPGDVRAETIAQSVKDCLYVFASLVYAKLTGASGIPVRAGLQPGESDSANADAVPYDLVYKYGPLEEFHKPVSATSTISTFGIVLQLGLIERTFITEADEWGHETQGRAFRFFHDQYTQRCLALVYRRDVLRSVSPKDLTAKAVLGGLVEKIDDLIQRSVNAPVLAGALDHWYHSNMRRTTASAPDLLLPLLNALVTRGSGGARYYVCSLLSSLILRGIVPASDLYSRIFNEGDAKLRLTASDGFQYSWPDLPPDSLTSLLEYMDKSRDDSLFGHLADIFAFHFADFPDRTLEYISQAVMPVTGLRNLTNVVINGSRFEKHLTFTLFFTFSAIRSQSDSPDHLSLLHKFIYANYRILIDSLVGLYGAASLKNVVRSQIYGRIQDNARDIWERLGATQNGNNYCFVEHHGLCQRDVVYEFFPYAAAMHNGDFDTFSIERGKSLRDLAIRMLTFDVTSIVGYKATVVLPFALRRDWDAAESFILDVLAVDNRSARFFGILLLVNLSYTEPALAERCLDLIHNKIQPGILAKNQEADWVALHAMGILDTNVEGLWPRCEPILRGLFDHFTRRADEAAINLFGDELLKASFFHDMGVGIHVAELMLSSAYLNDPLWRRCTLKVLAGLMARSPAALDQLLKDHGIPETILRETRTYVTEAVILARDIFTNQVSWNRFFGNIMAHNVILRCLTLKCIVAGFAQSNSTVEFAREFRRFLVSAVRAYYGKDNDEAQYAHIDVQQALDECESRRRAGGGIVHETSQLRQ